MAWLSPRLAVGVLVASPLLAALPALAHHGWSWASEEWFELSGTLTDVYIGQPHPTLTLNDGDRDWTVELSPVERTLASGFDEDTAAIGETVTAIGHRAMEEADYRMKAVRLITDAALSTSIPNSPPSTISARCWKRSSSLHSPSICGATSTPIRWSMHCTFFRWACW